MKRPARLTARAENQVTVLITHYAKLDRFEAITALNAAVAAAVLSIERGTARPRPYPATYANLAKYRLSWLKKGRYWFSFSERDDVISITNVFYDGADIPRRAARS